MKPIEFDIPARAASSVLPYATREDLRRLAKEIGCRRGRDKENTVDYICAERVKLRLTVEF